jgi:broad specificity phosphatase PhoE
MNLEWYIVRHGESEGNLKRIVQELHCPLTWKGKRQAKKAGKRLKHLQFKKVYTSDQKRVVDTTEIILTKLLYRPAVTENSTDFRERNFAHMRGMTYEEAGIAEIPTEELYAMDRGDLDILYDVESLDEIRERTSKTKNRILKENHPRILIVAHEWILSYFMNELLGEEISPKTFHPQHNCAISYFKLNDENGKVLEYRIAQDEI